MTARPDSEAIVLCKAEELKLVKTFECGQCFRWNPIDYSGKQAYIGIADKNAAIIFIQDDFVCLRGAGDLAFWRRYFDIETDYAAANSYFSGFGGFFGDCAEHGRGIRILRQAPWETLCSFIISQCNNIPRIKKIIETLCERYGEPIDFFGNRLYSFPQPEIISALDTCGLDMLRCGYRAPYIIAAARAVADGRIRLDELSALSLDSAIKALCALPGVGKKVASCAALYGLGNMSGFPVDTWMAKALREHFPKDFDPAVFGEYAGLAQQYIFYYMRENG